MTRFYKLQKISSIIPFWSTFVIAIITMIELKRNHASKRIWRYFILTFFAAGSIVFFINKVVMSGQHLFLNIVVSGLILAVANILFVEFQIMCVQTNDTETHIKSRTKWYVVVCCAAVIVLGLGILLFTLFVPTIDIEDSNGVADTSLVTISLDEILTSPDNYSAVSSYTSYEGASTNVDGRMKEYDHENCSFSCKKISGIITLQVTKTKNDQLMLDIFSQLDEGNAEIVIIVDDQYYDSIPINQSNSIELSNIANKTIVVRLAAESAKVHVAVERTEI